jgi:membrane-associated phospholipid phosphatase
MQAAMEGRGMEKGQGVMPRCALLVVVWSLGVGGGWMQQASAEQQDPFSVDPWVTVPLIVGGFVAAGSMDLIVRPSLPMAYCKPFAQGEENPEGWRCNPSGINAWDRLVLDNDTPGAKTTSDILVVVTMLSPVVGGLIDAALHCDAKGWENYGEDVLIVGETLAVNYLLNNIVKYGVRRARPFSYNSQYQDNTDKTGEARYEDPDAGLSFYSLHSSFSFAAATSFSYLFTQRHPGDYAQVVPVWLLTHALAATTAVLRVEAGKHFWSDIIVGAVVGSSLGIVIPYLHKRGDDGGSASGGAGAQLQVGVGSLTLTW